MSLALAILLHAMAAFESRTIPMENRDAIAFVGPAESGPMKSVFVLDGKKLTAYALQGTSQPREAVLPEGVTAFDVSDTDGDNQAEIIAVAGKRILRIPASGMLADATALFENDGILSQDTGDPYLYPLVYSISNRHLIGLPAEGRINLYTTSGESAGELPLFARENQPHWRPFQSTTSESSSGLEWNVYHWAVYSPDFPPDAHYGGVTPHAAPTRAIFARPARGESPKDWPWFTVGNPPEEGNVKVHFAWSGDLRQETMVNFEPFAEDSSKEAIQSEGEIYRYPGVLISTWEKLDFNGDGYDDIMLARLPEPGGSLGNLVRTVTNGTWPFELTVHLYQREKRRFDARPASLLEYRVNVTSILSRRSFEAIVLRDFNGDGRSDFGIVPNEKQFLVWLWGDNGFKKDPDYSIEFAEEMRGVEFEGELGNKHNWGVGMRTEHSLVVTFYSGD